MIERGGAAGVGRSSAACLSTDCVGSRRPWRRALAIGAIGTIIMTAALMLPPFVAWIRTGPDGHFYFRATADQIFPLLLTLVPQAVLVAAAIAVPVGILCGLRGRSPATLTRRLLVAIAVMSALVGWVNADRAMPAANQGFRQRLFIVALHSRVHDAAVLAWLPNVALAAITLLMAVRPNRQTSP